MYRFLLLVVCVLAAIVFSLPSQGFSQAQRSKSDRGRAADQLTPAEQSKIESLIEAARAKEAAGDKAERDRLLDEAGSIAGTRHVELNNLRGLVFEEGQWMTPGEIADLANRDRALEEYRAIRQSASDTLAGNCDLALWCERSGLENEARAHWLRALDFDMENREVRSRLGHVNFGNRWVTPQQMQTANDQADAAREILAKHQRETAKIVRLLDSSSKKKRAEGLTRLGEIDNPEWIIPLEVVFTRLNEEIANVAIERLASFEEREATQALMRIAVFHPWPATRELAATRLGTRERPDYVPDLIAMLATPVISQFSIQPDRTGGLLYQHLFTQQTDEKNIVRLTGRNVSTGNGGLVRSIDPRVTAQAMREAASRAGQLESMKEAFNRSVEQQNQVVIGVLSRALDLELGSDPKSWWDWWNYENEVYVASRPMSYLNTVENVTYAPEPVLARSYECLVAGTKVWTSTGLVPIEKLTVGDRVLARDVATGILSYRPVIRPTVRPASPTVEIQIEGDVIRASGGHPFWVSDRGWVKARDLNPQMRLETVAGSTPVLSVQPGEVAELYNLVVDQDANYFVGDLGILSHDNTIPSSVTKTLLQNRNSH